MGSEFRVAAAARQEISCRYGVVFCNYIVLKWVKPDIMWHPVAKPRHLALGELTGLALGKIDRGLQSRFAAQECRDLAISNRAAFRATGA